MDWSKIKKIDWAYLVSRREALLFNSITINCYSLFKKVTGIDWHVKYISYRSGGPILHSRKELDWLKNFFSNCDLKKIEDFRRRLIYYVSQSEKLAIKLEKVNYEKLKQDKLHYLAKKYFDCVCQGHNFLTAMVMADKALVNRIFAIMPNASEEQKQKWLGVLIYPSRDNSHIAEEMAFYQLVAMHHRHNPELKKAVDQHVKNFGWIGARGYHFSLVWNDKLITERIKSFLASNKNEMDELLYLSMIKKERKLSAAKLQRQLGLDSIKARKLLGLAREYAYLRTWRTDVLYRCGYRVRNLFFEIFRRAGLDRELMPWCTYLEMIKIAQTGRPALARKELRMRSKYYVSLRIGKHYEVISGRENYKKFESATKRALPIVRDIRGNVAYPGVVRGRVSVVLTGHDISKVKRNDILVAVMTFPNFVPAMEKAAAFVTDEGGILCHAAIVAREIRKPCIIGTKIATKVLKDGDLVEVDAEHGLVKKLN